MNNVILSGRLVANPEVMTTNDGNCIAKFSLAVDGPIRKNQEKDTDFFNITAFGKRAEFVGQYLKKGTAVIINGRLKSSSYINKDGEKRYGVEVIVNTIEFGIGNNPNRESAENYQDDYNQGYNQEYQDNGYDGYDQNYQQGNDNGYNQGNRAPQNNGYNQGNRAPQNNGHNQGNRAPQNNGYNQGNRDPQNNGYNQGNRVPQDNSNRGYQENNQRNNQSSNTSGYQRGNHGEGNGNNVNQRSQRDGNNQRLDPARAFSPVPTHGGFH